MPTQPDKVTKKLDALLSLLKAWRVAGGEKSTYLALGNLATSNPLLKDWPGTEEVFNLIEENTDGDITFKIRKAVRRHSDRADQPNNNPALYPVGVEIKIKDKSKLEGYFHPLLKKIGVKKFSANKIELIEVIKIDETRIKLIINGQINSEIKVNAAKGRWGTFLEVAEVGHAQADKAQSVADYFNTRKACPLYSNTTYELTSILVNRNGELSAAPGVKIKVKGPKTIARRKNKRT